MKIAICASMVFAEKMIEVKEQLEELGHIVFISKFAEGYLGKGGGDGDVPSISTFLSIMSFRLSRNTTTQDPRRTI